MVEKLRTKDLLNLGIFGTIYMVVVTILGVAGAATPGLLFGTMVVAAFVNGTVFMMYLTRVDRFGMVVVLALLMALIMMAIGRSWTTVFTPMRCLPSGSSVRSSPSFGSLMTTSSLQPKRTVPTTPTR